MADSIVINVANNFKQTATDLAALTKQFAATNKQMQGMRNIYNQTTSNVRQTFTATNAANKAALGLTGRLNVLMEDLVMLPVETARVNSEFIGFRNALAVATGGIDSANASMMRALGTADELRLPIVALTKEYAKFMNAVTLVGFSQQEAEGYFYDLAAAARTLNLSQQDFQGMMLALEQMVSKGTVSMEELRRQLGNALPGAVDIAALSMGYAEDEIGDFIQAVRNGEVGAKEFLKAFTPFLRARTDPFLAESLNTAAAAMTRLNNEWVQLKIGIGSLSDPAVKAGSDVLTGLLETVNGLIDSLEQFNKTSQNTAKVTEETFSMTKDEAEAFNAAKKSIELHGSELEKNNFAINATENAIEGLEDQIGDLQEELGYQIQKQSDAAESLKNLYTPAIQSLKQEIEEASNALKGLNAQLEAQKVIGDQLGGGAGSDFLAGGTQGVVEDTLGGNGRAGSGAMQQYFDNLKEQAYDIESVYVNAFKGVEDSIVSLVTTGKANFKDLARSIIADLTRMIAKQLILKALTAAIPGFGGFLGLSAGAPVASYASGSRFVPRDGLAYLHRGERVVPASQNTVTNNTVERPVNIVNVTDQSQMNSFMSSAMGEQIILNHLSRNPDAVRQVLQ